MQNTHSQNRNRNFSNKFNLSFNFNDKKEYLKFLNKEIEDEFKKPKANIREELMANFNIENIKTDYEDIKLQVFKN